MFKRGINECLMCNLIVVNRVVLVGSPYDKHPASRTPKLVRLRPNAMFLCVAAMIVHCSILN